MIKELQKRFIRTTMFVVSIMIVIFFISIISGYAFLNWRSDTERLSRVSARSFGGDDGEPLWDTVSDYGAPQAPPTGKSGTETDSEAGGVSDTGPEEMVLTEPGEAAQTESGMKSYGKPETPPGNVPGRGDVLGRISLDGGISLQNLYGRNFGLYFVVSTDLEGNIIFSDLTHSGDLTWEEMTELLKKVDADFTAELPAKRPIAPENGQGTEADSGEAAFSERMQKPETAARLIKRGYTSGYMYECSIRRGDRIDYVFLDLTEEIMSDTRLIILLIIICLAGWILILLLVSFLSDKAIRPIGENLEQQKEFITNAGHEIKTPLAVIVSNVDVQELHTGKSKWLDNIRTQALRLSDLTKQMLILSRMEEGSSAVFVSTLFDASQLLLDTLKLFRESAALRGIQIRTDVTPRIEIYASEEQYRQLLELLFDNAVKYAKENGFISVVLKQERRDLILRVRNNCDSLPAADPDQLFERFFRADQSRSRQTGGSGIGLAVVRAIAQKNGGKVTAGYPEDDVIEFEIILPLVYNSGRKTKG